MRACISKLHVSLFILCFNVMVVLEENERILFYLKETLQRLRVVGSTVSDLTGPRFEPQTLAPEANAFLFTHCPVSTALYKYICSYIP